MTEVTAPLAPLVAEVLEDRKAENIVTLEVAHLTTIAEQMVIASGTSNRHVKSLVDYVIEAVKSSGQQVFAVEGRETHEWVLLDLGHVLVHVMQAESREFYDLERLWTELPTNSESEV